MQKVTLGRSGITCGWVGLNLEPLRQMSFAESREVLDKALEAGVDFFDIGLPDEELQKRIGHGIIGRRNGLFLAGSMEPCSPEEVKKNLQIMLRGVKADYLDLLQIHDPDYLPRTGDHTGFYDALIQAKEAGLIKSIGITTGTYEIALNALEYGWYDSLQYPWTKDSEEDDLAFIDFGVAAQVGTISLAPDEIPGEEELDAEMKAQAAWEGHVMLLPADNTEAMDRMLAAL